MTNAFTLAGHTPSRGAESPDVFVFYDAYTGTLQYVVADPATKACAIIDPVHDYDEKSGETKTINADGLLAFIAERGLTLEWILDTHPHADHLSAAGYLHDLTGVPTAIGSHVRDVQKLWADFYDWPELPVDGSQWDRLFDDGDTFTIGSLPVRVLFTPGHTLASVAYVVGDAAFIHDTLFTPDSGTARADFPGGSAERLWLSIQDILSLPADTRLFTGHDYCPGDRPVEWLSTIEQQKAHNTHIAHLHTQHDYVQAREARDKTLPMPRLILHALQVNINGGRLPPPTRSGKRFLKIPLNVLLGSNWG